MVKLNNYKDSNRACWASIELNNGDPCWISVGQSSVLVKKSSNGLFGAKLYEEKDTSKAEKTAQALSELYPRDITPEGISNPLLKPFANAVLYCRNSEEVSKVLNDACKLNARRQSEMFQSPNSLQRNLLFLFNQGLKDLGFNESDDIESATISALSCILGYVQIKAGHYPIKGRNEGYEAIVGMAFMCFLYAPLKQMLESEGAFLSNEVLGKASLASYQLLELEKIARIYQKGLAEYLKIVQTESLSKTLFDFDSAIRKTLVTYIISKDEKELDSLAILYDYFANGFKK